jgi:outer membrane protein assembly factor BamB
VAPVARGAPPPSGSVVADSVIAGLDRDGLLVYASGDFQEIGEYTGSGVLASPDMGIASVPAEPLFGQVSTTLPDGIGGVFVGGQFVAVDGLPAANLIHIRADGQVDRAFVPKIDGLVDSLALDGDRLFVGVYGFEVFNASRDYVIALDARTGATVLPHIAVSDPVKELALQPAAADHPARLYVGTEADGVLGFDGDTGQPLAAFLGAPIGVSPVTALAVSPDTLYVGDTNGVRALDAATGQPTKFYAGKLRAQGAGEVDVLLLDSGRLYVGGAFQRLGALAGPLVALDPVTGNPFPGFAADVPGSIYALARAGNRLWAGGIYTNIRPSGQLIAIDPQTGAQIATTDRWGGQINALSAATPGLYVGGEFDAAHYLRRPGLAAIDARTGQLDPEFSPPTVTVLANRNAFHQAEANTFGPKVAEAGGKLFVGPRQSLGYCHPPVPVSCPAAYSKTTDVINTFDPRTGQPTRPALAPVHNLVAYTARGKHLYIVRRLENDRRWPDNQVDIHDARTGRLLTEYRLPLRGYVTSLTISKTRLYVGGSFRRTRPNGQPANLAVIAIDPMTGRLESRFDPHANGPVADIALAPGRLYITGLFHLVHLVRRTGMAAVDPRTGALITVFKPPVATYVDENGRLQATPETLTALFLGPSGDWFKASGRLERPAGLASLQYPAAVAAVPGGLMIAGAIEDPRADAYDPVGVPFVSRLATR